MPRGAWTAKALLYKNNPARASIAQNVRFFPDYCYSREGTSNITIGGFSTSAGKVGGMFNWVAPNSSNYLIYLDGTTIKRLDLSAGTIVTIGSGGGSARYPSTADLGPRVYCASADVTGTGQIAPFVHDGTNTDACFRGPLAASSFTAASDGLTGLCTQGNHSVAFLFQNRDGFIGQPSPISGGVLAFATANLATGLHGILFQLTVSGTITDAGANSAIIPIMTRADNSSNWFIVPSSALSGNAYPTLGTGLNPSVSFTINITDEDLAGADSALNNFNFMVTSGLTGIAAPPNPDQVVAYGTRMCYVSSNHIYASEIGNPQAISADFNLVPNPSQRRIKAAWVQDKVLFFGGDKWTGSVRDNGDEPATWPVPSSISEAKGPPFPNCVENRTLGTYSWVATEFGLEMFNGVYADRPITYLWSDQWKRINWNAAYAIQIADDITNLKVYVAAPLDANTECSHCFVVDYTNGLTWDTCDISIDNYGFGNFSSIRTVKESAGTNKTSVWIGPQAAGAIIHIDASTHQDAGASIIHAIWESGYDRKTGTLNTPLIRLGAQSILAQGLGTLIPTWYGMDRATSVQPCLLTAGATVGQIPLNSAPGQEYTVRADLSNVENYTTRFEVNSLGDWFRIYGYRTYRRPQRSNR